ncbi:MAG: type II toxin-antitoxin system Phd/YefM family antitoxin [Pseudomonas sp.]
MHTVNIHEAKTHLSRLIEQVAGGDTIVIAKAGKPIAKVVPLRQENPSPRRTGFMLGQISVPADFDELGREQVESLFTQFP